MSSSLLLGYQSRAAAVSSATGFGGGEDEKRARARSRAHPSGGRNHYRHTGTASKTRQLKPDGPTTGRNHLPEELEQKLNIIHGNKIDLWFIFFFLLFLFVYFLIER